MLAECTHMAMSTNDDTQPGPSRRRHSQFRPCIDLHQGVVKQIVGGTLDLISEGDKDKELRTNFVAEYAKFHQSRSRGADKSRKPSSYYASLYRARNLTGGHVIKLGPNNDQAAAEALGAWPGGLQVGGGISEDNAQEWLNKGADKVRLLA